MTASQANDVLASTSLRRFLLLVVAFAPSASGQQSEGKTPQHRDSAENVAPARRPAAVVELPSSSDWLHRCYRVRVEGDGPFTVQTRSEQQYQPALAQVFPELGETVPRPKPPPKLLPGIYKARGDGPFLARWFLDKPGREKASWRRTRHGETDVVLIMSYIPGTPFAGESVTLAGPNWVRPACSYAWFTDVGPTSGKRDCRAARVECPIGDEWGREMAKPTKSSVAPHKHTRDR